MRVYNKQWKRIFEITHVNEFGLPVDNNGVTHELEAVREVRHTDELVTYKP